MDVQLLGGTSATGSYNAFFWADYTGSVTSRLFINNFGEQANATGALVTGFGSASAVPEPSTVVMGATAALLGAGCAWRRRKGASA